MPAPRAATRLPRCITRVGVCRRTVDASTGRPGSCAGTEQGRLRSRCGPHEEWLAGSVYPVLGTFRAGDKGYYKVPAEMVGCGSEMYILGTLRHCVHSAKALYFNERYDQAWIFMLPQIGLARLNLRPKDTTDQRKYARLSKTMN